MLQTERLKAPETGDHTLPTWVAQNIMRASPIKSLEETSPKPYIICPHLNLQRQLQIQLEFRGLSANLHHMHFEKGSNDQVIITMQFLGGKYPKSIYGMGNLNFWASLTKIKNLQGLNCKRTKLQLLEGPSAKMHLTMLINSSSYPKFIYGMPLFSRMVKFRFEFEFKFKFELNQKRK